MLLSSRLGLLAQPGGTLRLALQGDRTVCNAHQGPAPGLATM
jgi:hypothetical protein